MDPIYQDISAIDEISKISGNTRRQNLAFSSSETLQSEDQHLIVSASPETFRDLVIESDNFIDKTLLLKDLEREAKFILITRPPGWGKSLNLDMIKSFYEVDLDENGDPRPDGFNKNRVLFEGGILYNCNGDSRNLRALNISSCNSVMRNQGKYPVIHIVFPRISPTVRDEEEIKERFKISIQNSYLNHKNIYKKLLTTRISHFIRNTNNTELSVEGSIEDLEKRMKKYRISRSHRLETFRKYMTADPSMVFSYALDFLIRCLYEFFDNTPVYVLIDEYDGPLNRIMWTDHYETAKHMHGYILDPLTEHSLVKKVILTGSYLAVSRDIADPHKFNRLNMLNEDLEQYFGFTVHEVNQLIDRICNHFSLSELEKSLIENETKRWYNGYCLNGTSLYNPRSIITCFSKIIRQKGNTENVFQVYHRDEIYLELNENFFGHLSIYYNSLSTIISNKIWTRQVESMFDTSLSGIDLFFKLLLDGGYLVQGPRGARDPIFYKLPNKEVEDFFYEALFPKWLHYRFGSRVNCENLVRDSCENIEDKEAYIQIIQRQLLDNTDIDFKRDEDFHAALVGCEILAGFFGISKHDVYFKPANQQDAVFHSLFLPIKSKSETMIIQIYK